MSNSAWLSEWITVFWVNRPCFWEFHEAMAFPCWVRGPVDFWAFLRFAAICFSVAMIVFSINLIERTLYVS